MKKEKRNCKNQKKKKRVIGQPRRSSNKVSDFTALALNLKMSRIIENNGKGKGMIYSRKKINLVLVKTNDIRSNSRNKVLQSKSTRSSSHNVILDASEITNLQYNIILSQKGQVSLVNDVPKHEAVVTGKNGLVGNLSNDYGLGVLPARERHQVKFDKN